MILPPRRNLMSDAQFSGELTENLEEWQILNTLHKWLVETEREKVGWSNTDLPHS